MLKVMIVGDRWDRECRPEGAPRGGNMRGSSVKGGICGLCLWAPFTPCHF